MDLALGKNRESETREGRLICHCEGVSLAEIKASIRAGASDVASIGRACGAGEGCGSCCKVLDLLLLVESPSKPLPKTA